jgi:hypothetical protein
MANTKARSSASISPRRKLALIVIAAGLVLCAGVYFLFTAPARSAVATDQTALTAEQQSNLLAQEQYAAAASQGPTAGAKIYQNTKTLDQLLPQTCLGTVTPKCSFDKTAFNLTVLSALPAQYGLSAGAVTLCVPGTYQTATYCAYTMTATGTYTQIVSLVKGIGSLTPLTTVQSILTTPATASTGTTASSSHALVTQLTATISLRTWFVNDVTHLPVTSVQG